MMFIVFLVSLLVESTLILVETSAKVTGNLPSLVPTSPEAIIVDTLTEYFHNQSGNNPVVVNLGPINLLFGPLPIEAILDNLRIYGTEDVVVNSITISNELPYIEFDFTFPKLQFETDESPAQYVANDQQTYPITLGTWAEAIDSRWSGRADYITGDPIRVENVKSDITAGNGKTKLTASFPDGKYTKTVKEELRMYEEILRLRQLDQEITITYVNLDGVTVKMEHYIEEEIYALRDLYMMELNDVLNRNMQTILNNMFL